MSDVNVGYASIFSLISPALSPCAIASAKMLIHSSPDCPTTWAQEGINFDPAPDVVDLGGRKIELIYVGDTACTVDCSSSGHRPFAMSVREYEVNLSLRSLDSLDADAGFDLNPDAPACFLQ